MFRSLNEVLLIKHEVSDIIKIIKSPDRCPDTEKDKFILGIKFIYDTQKADIGFTLLNSIGTLDTAALLDKQFVEDLLSIHRESSVSLGETLKIIQFILEKASCTDSFEMAIHQHMVQYAQSAKVSKGSLTDVLTFIKIISDRLNGPNLTTDMLETLCVSLLSKIMSKVPVARDTESIQAMNIDSIKIVEFFQSLRTWSNFQTISSTILTTVYDLITKDEEVSPLTCLGLAVIPDSHIGNSVGHILTMNRFNNQKKTIMIAIERLLTWQKTTNFHVPLHLWIVKVMTALYDEKQYEILNEIILKQINTCYLTLIIPAFQVRTIQVVQVMFEVQRSEEIFRAVAPRIVKVLVRLEDTKSEIYEPTLDIIAEYVSSFPNAEMISKQVVDYLELKQGDTNRIRSKYRRYSPFNSLNNNVRIGLENLGNTCYMNSVIQALFMTKPFCNELLTMERADRDTMIVQKIFALLLFSERSELNLKFAMPHIRPADFVPGIQHDSSEFMGSLLDKLHEADKKFLQTNQDCDDVMTDMVGAIEQQDVQMEVPDNAGIETMNVGNKRQQQQQQHQQQQGPVDKVIDNTNELAQPTFVQKIFGGKLSTTCVCSSCDSKSISIDSFRDLSLSFPENEKNEDDWDAENEYSVQRLLDYYFTSEQLTLDGDNQYHCEKCQSLCDGIRCTELLQPPKNLILTLKHFAYDSRYHTRSKLLIKKMFHDEVISVKVQSIPEGSHRIVKYRLYAAVVHSGVSLDSGHYYTFAREKDETWYKFNDSFVSTSSLHELHNLNSPNTPYILFYRRISTASSTPSSSVACSLDFPVPTNDDKLPNFEDLPAFLRQAISEDNAAYKKETRKFAFQQNKPLSKQNRWNDDDPPSSCGSNFDLQPNRFIY